MIYSTRYCFFIATALLLTLLMVAHAASRQNASVHEQAERARLVAALQLTDLCLFTEARYTRNPAMADMFAPFQDFPGSLEHFPSGSLVSPPSQRKHAAHP